MCQSATMWKLVQPSSWRRTQFSSAPTWLPRWSRPVGRMPERMRPVVLGTGDPSRWKSWGAGRLSDARRAVNTRRLHVTLEARVRREEFAGSRPRLELLHHDQRGVGAGALRSRRVEARGYEGL